jgi:hypothetical protein
MFKQYNYHLFTETEGNSVVCTLVPEVYFSSPLRNEINKNKPLEPGYVVCGPVCNNGGRGGTKHTAFPRSQ